MTMTVLDRAPVAGDAGRVSGEQERPDPEVPERAPPAEFHRAVQAGGPGRLRRGGTR